VTSYADYSVKKCTVLPMWRLSDYVVRHFISGASAPTAAYSQGPDHTVLGVIQLREMAPLPLSPIFRTQSRQ